MTLRSFCLVLLSAATLVGLPPATTHAETAQEQAARQLEFARTELEAGRHQRAIGSAESALRLDPTQLEAIVLKALAFEALGDIETAESLLVAYLDFARGREVDPRVAATQERLAASDKRKKKKTETIPSSADHKAASRKLVGLGRCDEALVPAITFIDANPKEPVGYAVLGDVHRCATLERQAGLDYRKAISLGSKDSSVRMKLKEIEGKFATVLLEFDAESLEGLTVHTMLGNLPLQPLFGRNEARFDLMPADTPFNVEIGGRGYLPQTITVPGVARGESHTVTVTPTYLGTGTVTVADWPPGGIDRVEIMDGYEATLVYPGQSLTLVAGTTTARIINQIGTLEVPVEIVRDQQVTFEPGRWMPASVVVKGLPTGCTVEVALDQQGEEWVSRDVPKGGGTLNQASGVFIAAPVTVDGLLAGPSTLRVRHSTLGVGAQSVTLAPAVANEVEFDLTQLPESGALTRKWKAHNAKATSPKFTPPVIGSLIGGGVAFVLGGIFAGVSADSATKERGKYDIYFDAVGTGVDTDPLLEDFRAQTRTTEGTRAAAGVFFGIGAVGVGVSIPLSLLIKPKGAAKPAAWEPEGF